MRLTLNWAFIVFPVFWLLLPLASYADALLNFSIGPQVSTISINNPSHPSLLDYFWWFMSLNSWELFLVTAGAVAGIKSWGKKIVWRGKPIEIRMFEKKKKGQDVRSGQSSP